MVLTLSKTISSTTIPYSAVVSRLNGLNGNELHDSYKSAAASLSSERIESFDNSRYTICAGALTCDIAWVEACLRDCGGNIALAITSKTAPLLISSYRRLCDISQDVPILSSQKRPVDYQACIDFARAVSNDLRFKKGNDMSDKRLLEMGVFAHELFYIIHHAPQRDVAAYSLGKQKEI